MSVFFNSHEVFTYILHDFTCILLSITAQNIDATVQDIETKGNPVNLAAFFYCRFLSGTLIWNNMNS